MKKILSLALAIVLFSACEKNPVCEEPLPVPTMHYTDLGNAEIKYQQSKSIDVNHDGKNDFYFEVLLVGDPLLKRDRMQFYATSKIETLLLNDENDQSPMLTKGAAISAQHSGYTWWEISSIVLTEKITPEVGTPFWAEPWQNAAHHFLPIQVKKKGQFFFGWIELSFDKVAEKLILHRAGLSTIAGKDVKAGY